MNGLNVHECIVFTENEETSYLILSKLNVLVIPQQSFQIQTCNLSLDNQPLQTI